MLRRAKRKYNNIIPFLDVLLILLIVAMALINPIKEDAKITPRADAMLQVEWDSEINADVDTWIRLPNNEVISFVYRDAKIAVLRRDDLGQDLYFTQPQIDDAEQFEVLQNLEVVDFQKLIDGVYVVNIHLYNLRSYDKPIDVSVELTIMDPFHKVIEKTVTIVYQSQEITLFTFTVEDGKVVDLDETAVIKIATGGR